MSDYISREKAIKSICQYGTAQERIGRYAVTISELKQTVADTLSDLPSADVIEIPEGLTNEDVLNDTLRRVFPRVIFIRSIDELNKTQGIHMSEEWLIQPYKGADMRGET